MVDDAGDPNDALHHTSRGASDGVDHGLHGVHNGLHHDDFRREPAGQGSKPVVSLQRLRKTHLQTFQVVDIECESKGSNFKSLQILDRNIITGELYQKPITFNLDVISATSSFR